MTAPTSTPAAPTPNNMPGAGHAAAAAPPAAPVQQAAQAVTGQGMPVQPLPATGTPGAAPADGQPPAAAGEPDNRPPWEKNGEPFDPERAWTLTQNLRTELSEAKTKLQEAQPILDQHEQLRRASQSDLDRAREDIQTLTGERDSWRDRAVRADALAMADRFIDAEAALALIGDLSGYTGKDGVDTAKLTARFDQLAADKPHLVAAAPQPPGFTPNRAQGQAGTGGAPSLDAQIKAAEERGDVMTSIALKQQKAYQK
jgi:hypothetical protein